MKIETETPKRTLLVYPRSMDRLIRSLLSVAAILLSARIAGAQAQAVPFFDDSTVQTINLTMDPDLWAIFQQYYDLDTYYPATFTWNGITESIAVRPHGGASRSPVKPNLDLNF